MEIIRFGSQSSKLPLLFIHGSYCGAWIWERHFLPYFAKAGYEGAAISLRGHGNSPGAETIDQYGIAAYVEDILDGMNLFDRAPVLIGHSLGGYLIQRLALVRDLPGMVLLSAPSLVGLTSSSQHILVNNPPLAIQLGLLMAFGPGYVDQDIIGEALFSASLSENEKAAVAARLQKESTRVTTEAFWPCWDIPQRRMPALVIGGKNDAFVPVSDFEQASGLWHAELKILDDAPHALMLAPCWSRVAGEIREWLDRL